MPETLAKPGYRYKPAKAGTSILPPLILMTDAVRGPDPGLAALSLKSGTALVLRHYGDPGRAELARQLALICRRRGVLFLVAADWRLAFRIGADGVHLPEGLARRGPRAWGSPAARDRGFLVTAAAHSFPAITRAAAAGVDAVLLSPVFSTASHPGAASLGPVRFALSCRKSPVPVYALGGLNPRTAARMAGTGLAGIAGVSGLAGLETGRQA
ncbi:MAG: thiamine phosphate synthase [Rhodospirillales bacterium]|nr:thiamine phosphate synthase [Rhodospirillales bacterium]